MEELLSLKWNNHRSTFLHILTILRDKQLYTDATLACEGRFYSVHRLVLSTCSDYFSAMFDRTTCKNPIIVLKDIKCEDLEALLDYMYLGEVNVRQADLASLIKAAECLRVKGLAVPDDEPPRKGGRGDNSNRRTDGVSSPPSKRKRRDEGQDGREGVRPSARMSPSSRPKMSQSQPTLSPTPQDSLSDPGRTTSPSHLQSTDGTQGNNLPQSSIDGPVETPFVKVEMEDSGGDDMGGGDSFNVNNDSFKEEADTDQGGDLSNDLPEFLQQASGSSYPHSFAGPSFQPDLQNWQGDQVLSGNYSGLGFGPTQSQDGSQNASGRNVSKSSSGLSSAISSMFPALAATLQTSLTSSSACSRSSLVGKGSSLGRGTFVCSVCNKAFLSGWELRRHLHAHGDSRPFRCPYCTHRSNFKHNLKSHIQMVHRGMPFNYRVETTPFKQ